MHRYTFMKRNIICSLTCSINLTSLMLRTAFLKNSQKFTLSKEKFGKLILLLLWTFCDTLDFR